MQKRIIIVHGWDGFPEEGWFPWLKSKLESRGSLVVVPQLPNPGEPRIHAWVSALKEVVGEPDENTYFVGHSMGCQTIARYLEGLDHGVKVGGVVFVAGFFRRLTNLEEEGIVHDVVREWLTTPIDLERVKAHVNKSVAIFSDDDPYVPLDNQDDFHEKLGSTVIIEHAKGHFSGSTGTIELPVVLSAVLEMSQS